LHLPWLRRWQAHPPQVTPSFKHDKYFIASKKGYLVQPLEIVIWTLRDEPKRAILKRLLTLRLLAITAHRALNAMMIFVPRSASRFISAKSVGYVMQKRCNGTIPNCRRYIKGTNPAEQFFDLPCSGERRKLLGRSLVSLPVLPSDKIRAV
jgi:hypothetical protein